jgi:ubiquinone/menaquinone biosynthesis C-methylase UbiE
MEEDMNIQRPEHDFSGIESTLIDGIASRLFMESVRVKLFDIMESPVTPDQISRHISLDRPILQAVLDFLEARKLVVNSDGCYVNSPQAAEFLVSSSPFYQGNILEMQEQIGDSACAAMRAFLRDQPVKYHESDYGKKKSSAGNMNFLLGPAQFAMRGTLQDAVAFIVDLPQFMSAKKMCDIGGNHGHYTTALLDRNPSLSAVIADIPKITGLVEPGFQNSDYRDRISVLPFDLRRDTLPEQSYDLVLSSFVLHIFAENFHETIKKIAGSLQSGGVFVTQNMDPGTQYGCQKEKTVREVTTKMLGYPTHFLNQELLEDALREAGFADYRVQRTGPDKSSYILAAVKQ